ncbi:MAG TPA: ABC transporter permease [Bacteroidales bacterium]|jgi:molybdate/tungstate transport system permease protein|nr:MAG: Sulfate transport system permease protein CysT [Bacteroidetes bacterium ADurb.Bin012]HNQ59982.1 ABC transporter permease [Bacteroidales bacterium]HNU21558.1 ABC transporter permease [Bacteroidales bacterium]HNV17127.1 ABC transporter permease [Bacteroidales bacterium]HOC15688.1 ABC transporter permease [Bacteroidales bacterium]
MPYKSRNFTTFSLVMAILGGLVLLFILAPLLGMFLRSSPNQIVNTIKEPEVSSSLAVSLFTAFVATFIGAIGAIPLAYLLARKQFRGKLVVLGLIDLPVVIPHTAAGIAILGVISRNSLIGSAAARAGFDLIGTPISISCAMAFVSLPFLINAARSGFEAVPIRLEKAASNLGASSVRTFFTVSLPLAWRSILSGLVMMFARGMSEFGAVIIVAYHPMTAPVLIFERFNNYGLNYANPLAAILILVSLVFFILLRLLAKPAKNA